MHVAAAYGSDEVATTLLEEFEADPNQGNEVCLPRRKFEKTNGCI